MPPKNRLYPKGQKEPLKHLVVQIFAAHNLLHSHALVTDKHGMHVNGPSPSMLASRVTSKLFAKANGLEVCYVL